MTPKYVRLKPEDRKRMVETAMEVWRALDGKPMQDCWLALLINIQRLGNVMLEKLSSKELKTELHKYLLSTEEWIIAYRKNGELRLDADKN